MVRVLISKLTYSFRKMLFVLLLFGVCVSANSQNQNSYPPPQCGHFAITKLCHLIGVPLSIPEVIKTMPRQELGHSFNDLKQTLYKFGVKSEGIRIDTKNLVNISPPFIAHVKPCHWVVVKRIENNHIYLYDEQGKKTHITLKEFNNKFSGMALITNINSKLNDSRVKIFNGPHIKFDTLISSKCKIKDNKYAYTFIFHNHGNKPAIIKSVKTSCSCTDYIAPPNSIPSGKKGKITLLYNNISEIIDHDVTYVKTNDPNFPYIKLIVEEENLSEKYDIYTDTKLIDLGEYTERQKNIIRKQIVLMNPSKEKYNIKSIEYSGNTFKLINASAYKHKHSKNIVRIVGGPFSRVLDLSFKLDNKNNIGGQVGKLIISTDNENFSTLLIPVFAKKVSPISSFPKIVYFKNKRTQKITFKANDGRLISVLGMKKIPTLKCAWPSGDHKMITVNLNLAEKSIIDNNTHLTFSFKLEGDPEPVEIQIPISSTLD